MIVNSIEFNGSKFFRKYSAVGALHEKIQKHDPSKGPIKIEKVIKYDGAELTSYKIRALLQHLQNKIGVNLKTQTSSNGEMLIYIINK